MGVFSKGAETDEGARTESTQPNITSDSSGYYVAQTMQLNHLLSQLNNLLHQQTPGFVYSKAAFNSSKINNNFKIAHVCQNTNRWITDSGATDYMHDMEQK